MPGTGDGPLSPDGRRLAIGLNTREGDDIWIKELDDGALTRLTFDAAEDARPAWTPDGQSVMYFSYDRNNPERSGDLYVRRADGATAAELLLDEEPSLWTVHPSPSGGWWLLQATGTAGDIRVFRPGVDTASTPLLCAEGYNEVAPALSPDGRFLAYASDESGRQEVYVRPFPDVETARWTVSTAGGNSPVWSHAGGELLYLTLDSAMASVRVETRPTFRVLDRRVLFQLGAGYSWASIYTGFELTPTTSAFSWFAAPWGEAQPRSGRS